jgi:hypothetical protein
MDEIPPPADVPAPPARRRRPALTVPVPAALVGLGLCAAVPDAGALVARPDVLSIPSPAPVANFDVLANDTFGNNVAIVFAQPTTLGHFAPAGGSPPRLDFTPSGQVGARIASYCIQDAVSNGCSYIYVNVQNGASTVFATDDFYATTRDTPLFNLRVLANDAFNADTLEVSRLLHEQAFGTATVSPSSAGGFGTWGPPTVVPSGPSNASAWMIDYAPPPGFVGVDRFQYCIGNFYQPGTQTCATVFVNVAPPPAVPVPALGGAALAGLSGALGWLAMRLRRRG